MKSIFDFAKEIGRPLILDGAMGSLLQQKGLTANTSLWSAEANSKHPETVIDIHKKYISAGADIITTNTFRTNPAALNLLSKRKKTNPDKMVKAAVFLAIKASNGKKVVIAGCNPPAEDCYKVERTLNKKEIAENHLIHTQLLYENGADIIWNETQSHFDEIKIICEYCSSNKFPFVISLFFTEDLNLLSGENLFEVINKIKKYNPLAIGFNCISPAVFNRAVKKIPTDLNWGFYLNCGGGSYKSKNISCAIDDNEYLGIVKKYLPYKPSFVGACCGSNPKHIKKIKTYFDGLYRN